MISTSYSLPATYSFVCAHPGLLLVLVGVIGESACDWKDLRRSLPKLLFVLVLVIGLVMEFGEAATSDHDIAVAKDGARRAQQTNEVLALKIEGLNQTNIQNTFKIMIGSNEFRAFRLSHP